MNRISLAIQAARQLGFQQVSDYALYQVLLRLGVYRRMKAPDFNALQLRHLPQLLARLAQLVAGPEEDCLAAPAEKYLAAPDGEDYSELLAQAGEIANGRVRLFGAAPQPLRLAPPAPPAHWTQAEKLLALGEDAKDTWEPARFGWAFTLGQAYAASGDERFAEAFWGQVEEFLKANPPYLGLNWSSAQEVALRLMAWSWALRAFIASPASSPARQVRLLQAIAVHAARIPPTLVYARAQNNNHLLTEAAGLYSAGRLFEDVLPQARRWRRLGWKWFQLGILRQVTPDGIYSQHSANYQRLMLQAALWMKRTAAAPAGDAFPRPLQERLAAATAWLAQMVDPITGEAPNLGPNDGAYIFPLAGRPAGDFRPVLRAAQRAFPWSAGMQPPEQGVLRSGASWAYLRAVHFTSRPGHSDQLHLDLWHRGWNLARDPGTYRYTAPAPWENALTHAAVHNTLTVAGVEPMRRVGRFLYLDWAQAAYLRRECAPDGSWQRLTARATGYRRFGILHERCVTAFAEGRWWVEDRLFGSQERRVYQLHWLLPDWPWELDGDGLRLEAPFGQIHLKVEAEVNGQRRLLPATLYRAGELVAGEAVGQYGELMGWYAPTYSVKIAGLSLLACQNAAGKLIFHTDWRIC